LKQWPKKETREEDVDPSICTHYLDGSGARKARKRRDIHVIRNGDDGYWPFDADHTAFVSVHIVLVAFLTELSDER
jgi:hypothetical protein